jgi:cytidyltransferase-like protein
MNIVIVSGGFDPLHSGHINYLNAAKKLGDKLIVALNSDNWLENKKTKFFMPFKERRIIIENLVMVDDVIAFRDDEHGSCIDALNKTKRLYPHDNIIFCNGGDRTKMNIPEMSVSGINFMFGVGGNFKANSSSSILKDYAFLSEDRIWGKFYVLFKDDIVKVKELILYPNKGISLQRHFARNELWFVSKGSCLVKFSKDDPKVLSKSQLSASETYLVKKGTWHQVINPYDTPCHIIEIQFGEQTIESDIERYSYYENNEIT